MAPAHAHFNLVGRRSAVRVRPLLPNGPGRPLDRTLAKWPGGLHILGALLFPVGVAVVIKKGESFIVLPIIGSLIVLVATALFALIVFRTSRIR